MSALATPAIAATAAMPRTPRAMYFNDEVYIGFCQSGDVRKLKGFGAKTEETILTGLAFATSEELVRLYWAEADVIAQQLREHLRTCRSIKQLEIAGSYRRGRETVGDLDLLAEAESSGAAMDRLGAAILWPAGRAARTHAAPPVPRPEQFISPSPSPLVGEGRFEARRPAPHWHARHSS